MSDSTRMVFVVTGATSGIGLQIVTFMLQQGSSVIGIGRSAAKTAEVDGLLRRGAGPGARLGFVTGDLGLQSEVVRISDDIRGLMNRWGCQSLDGLINNAATVPFWQTLTAEGFDTQWAVNHLAGFLLTHRMLPFLQNSHRGRVVTVSSESHRGAHIDWNDVQLLRHYSPLRAYGQTKLANIVFSAEFNRRYAATTRMRAFAADPGLVNTPIGEKSNSALARWIWNLRRRGGALPQDVAPDIAYLATESSLQNCTSPYWHRRRPKRPSLDALNPRTARLLWDLSARMCGLAV